MTVCQPSTTFSRQGYPQYRRDRQEDLRVCQHHRASLEDWDGHVFVEFAGTDKCTMYLYKYVYKGASKVKLRLTNAEDVREDDEINLYLRGRYLCSMDAMWRTLGYQTYPSPKPSVLSLDVKLPEQANFFLGEGKLTTIIEYFARPALLHHLKYTELFTEYVVIPNKLPSRFTEANRGVDFHELHIEGYPQVKVRGVLQDRKVYLCKRVNPEANIVRMSMLYPSAGEIWYLRVLLLHRPCMSFEDARTHEGVVYPTFQMSAVMHGLVDERGEADRCFNDARAFSTPAELRSLFVFMTIQGFPTMSIFEDPESRDAMTSDYDARAPRDLSDAEKEQLLLKDLQELISEDGSCKLSDFGLPDPVASDTELQKQMLRYPPAEQLALLQALNLAKPNNPSQLAAYNRITSCIDDVVNNAEQQQQVCLYICLLLLLPLFYYN